MSKLEHLQSYLTNDLRFFRAPFFENMETVPAPDTPGSARYRMTSLDVFEQWLICGIVGGRSPSTYSESPDLWNPYFHEIDQKGVFFAFDLPDEKKFPDFLHILFGIPGFLEITITDPYKNAAFQALSRLGFSFQMSEQARHTRAVNHLVLDRTKHRITALNTDGLGMLWSIKKKTDIEGKQILIIGAGGSAASIGYEFARAGNDLKILNRTPEKAKELAQRLGECKNARQQIQWAGFKALKDSLGQADIVINTVPEGCPVRTGDGAHFKGHAVLADTTYGSKAALKDTALSANLEYVDGKAMLFGQFVEAAAHVYPLLEIPEQVHQKAVRAVASERL